MDVTDNKGSIVALLSADVPAPALPMTALYDTAGAEDQSVGDVRLQKKIWVIVHKDKYSN